MSGTVKASGSTTLTLVPEIGTFNQSLVFSGGEIWQDYQGPASAPTAVNPDYSKDPKVLTLFVSSSRASGSELPDKAAFFLNSVKIGEISKASGSGYNKPMSSDPDIQAAFELLDPTQNGGNYGLKFKGNLVKLTGGVSGRIRCEFVVSDGANSATISTDVSFRISQVTSDSSKTVIEADDEYNFQITDSNSSVKMRARFYRGVDEVVSGLSYEWYRQEYGANPTSPTLKNWEELVDETSALLTVDADDVDSSRMYMVRVFEGTGTDKKLVGQDTQRVDDRSDLYEIGVKRDPEDGQVHASGDSVKLTCSVYKRGSATPIATPGAQWTFSGASPAGTPIFDVKQSSNIYTVYYADVFNAGGQLEVMYTVEF